MKNKYDSKKNKISKDKQNIEKKNKKEKETVNDFMKIGVMKINELK